MEATRNAIGPPEALFARHGSAGQRTFYKEGEICVTDQWLTISGRRFAVTALHNLRTVREPITSLLIACTMIACVLVVAVAALAALAGEPMMIIGGPVVAALPIGVALINWRTRRQYLALYAEYGDQTVQVLGVSDERRYNQICRALIRAREYGAEHHD